MAISSALGAGIDSVFFTWTLNRTGVVQTIAKTTSPFFKGVFAFGAVNGAIAYATKNLKEKVKRDFTTKGSNLELGVDVLEFAITIASRYAVAKVFNRYFGTRITNKFVHILSVSDIISHTTPIGTPPLLFWGIMMVSDAKILSIFMKTPLFNSAFSFGMIRGAVSFTILSNYPKIHVLGKKRLGVEDPRILYISHFTFIFMATASIYFTMKICNRYLALNIPRNFVITLILSSIPLTLLTAFLHHIWIDFFGADFSQSLDKFRNSENPQTVLVIDQIKEILRYRSEVDLNIVRSRPFGVLFMLWYAGKLLVSQCQEMLKGLSTTWLRGFSIEDTFAKSLEILVSNQEVVANLLATVKIILNVEENKHRVQFILNDVLKDASQATKEAFIVMNPDRNTIQFVATKAVCIYSVGSKKKEEIPTFFSPDTIIKIQNLRTTLQDHQEMVEHYETILQYLQDSTSKDTTDDFFAFQSEFEESSDQLGALRELQEIGYPEIRTFFAKTICRIAAEDLTLEE